ncbi:MAG: MaoC family dehydratase [Cytophagaceae bacterium]|nr:MaoC family dehydratase [Cytophagaceae bacterium]MDW8455628.1 MaoC family dehydratase [Cytophagaceae bacterium]
MFKVGDRYAEKFSFTQEQVIRFAELTGDKNPIHLDPEYAATTPFKKNIIHGAFSASIFSKILGMKFPGKGTIYLKQEISFKRPMYVDCEYEAILTILELNPENHTALIETIINDAATQKRTVEGRATVMHKELI